MTKQKPNENYTKNMRSELIEIMLSWILLRPNTNRFHVEGSNSKQRPRSTTNIKLWVGWCGFFLFIFVVRCNITRYCEVPLISVFEHDRSTSERIQPELRTLINDDIILGLRGDPKKTLKSIGSRSNPNVENPLISLDEEWSKSFKAYIVEQKLGNEIQFVAKFYFWGKLIFTEKLNESKRT